jgi:hypothetical protein
MRPSPAGPLRTPFTDEKITEPEISKFPVIGIILIKGLTIGRSNWRVSNFKASQNAWEAAIGRVKSRLICGCFALFATA